MLAETQLFLSLLAMLMLQIDNGDELVDTDVINSFLVGVSAVCTPIPMAKFVHAEVSSGANEQDGEMTENPLDGYDDA